MPVTIDDLELFRNWYSRAIKPCLRCNTAGVPKTTLHTEPPPAMVHCACLYCGHVETFSFETIVDLERKAATSKKSP